MSSGNSLLIVRMATPLRDPIDQFVDLGLAPTSIPRVGGLCKRVVTVAPFLFALARRSQPKREPPKFLDRKV
jgi:hypothetical protein